MTNNLPESLIIKIWQNLLLDRTDLVTEEGAPIKIIYPGRTNDDQGADLRDTVIATSQGLKKGDIEIHAKSSAWRAHRHHQDPNYNRVILHIVMWRDTEVNTPLQNGREIPILALHKYIDSPASRHWNNPAYYPVTLNMPCRQTLAPLSTGMIIKLLDSAGEERFLAKETKFEADFTQMEASQSLYQGIMGGLGYSKNKLPFLELARRLPLQTLESLSHGKIADEKSLARQQALLLGTAGLLPSQRPNWHQKNGTDDSWIEKLEKWWISSRRTKAMSENNWHLCKVRPNNSPTRRIAAMSYLILRYREKGILEEVVNKIRKTAISQGYRELEKVLMVNTIGYWASRFDFSSGSRIGLPALLGSNRAAAIAVNVLLPFTSAWGKLTSQPELAGKALALYCGYPKVAANAVERHMSKQLGLNINLVNSAQRQQGLIHIYNTLCSQGKCCGCPLGEQTIYQE